MNSSPARQPLLTTQQTVLAYVHVQKLKEGLFHTARPRFTIRPNGPRSLEARMLLTCCVTINPG